MLKQMFRRQLMVTVLFVLAFVINAARLSAKTDIDASRVREIAAMLPAHATGLGEPASHREAWIAIAKKPVFEGWLKSAHQELASEKPKSTDELYLDFSRTGNRDHWQGIEFARRTQLATFALAECLENNGTFLKSLETLIKDICAERTWVYPAHDRNLGNFNGTQIDIDLGSSRVGWELATIKYLLGDKLTADTRKLISDNLHRRILKPYRDMVEGRITENGWLRVNNNWNAVCHAGVVGTALAEIESPEERAWFITASQIYIKHFLEGFGTDGYCSEGMGYWNYGFGHFIMLSETIRQATGGEIDWIAEPAARLPALFGRRAEIFGGIYPSIADCHPGSRPDPQLDAYVCQRLSLTPCDHERETFVRPASSLFTSALFCFLPEKLPLITSAKTEMESPLRTWFSDGGVLICRQQPGAKVPFSVSLKGGHNGESHNHNDLGSFIVLANRSMVLVDPGSEVYTARTFSSKRYESDVLSSFGHDVPVIAGALQSTGRNHRATVLRTEFTDASDTLALDLKSAYAVPSLTKLIRTFTFKRGDAPSLTVTDEVEFTQPESFATALVTWAKWRRLSPTEIIFTEATGAVRVKIDTGGVPFDIHTKQLQADVTTPAKALRLGIAFDQPVQNAKVTFTITPEPLPPDVKAAK